MKRPLTWILLVFLVGLLVYFIYFNPNGTSTKTNTSSNSVTQKKQQFKLKVNSKQVIIDGNTVTLQAPVLEIEGNTMVPLRFIAEYLNAKDIQYDPATEEISFYLELPAKTEAKKDTKTKPVDETTQSKDNDTMVTVYDQMLTKEREERIKSIARVSTTIYRLSSITSD
ncbi:MAG: stalk domain-containing protein, partial [Caldisericia bacterium]|nr:stalk domain-containing protein [Caldisericia bacterium]